MNIHAYSALAPETPEMCNLAEGTAAEVVMRSWLYAYLNLTILCRYVEVHVAGKLLLLLGLLVLFCFILHIKRCIGNANMLVICALIHTVQVRTFESRFGPWTKCQFGRMPSW